jgi:uncharacterized membrane protein YedE/YeeE
MDWIYEPWPWYVAGPIIAILMFLLLVFGKNFGMSANLRTTCAILGGGKVSDFFRFDWKTQIWNLVFAGGAILGGWLTHTFLTKSTTVDISSDTKESLRELGFENPGAQYLPDEIFGMEALTSPKGLLILILGGFMVGFGARYAGGCTSGHAISGLSDLQLPSLIAVIGFFVGGLIMTFVFLPMIY